MPPVVLGRSKCRPHLLPVVLSNSTAECDVRVIISPGASPATQLLEQVMTSKDVASRDEPVPTTADSHQGGQFVERMFSGFGHTSDLRSAPTGQRSEEPYHPLRQSRSGPGALYRLQSQTPELRVR